jgi:adenine-specific DNA-methyltransferase
MNGEQAAVESEGFRHIADLAQERIRRVIQKIKSENQDIPTLFQNNKQDLGFKSFRLAYSNFKQWRNDVQGEEAILKQLEMFIHSEKEDSRGGEMLYELLLKAGFSLTAKVELAEIEGQAVYTVEEGKMLIFFDDYTPAINAYVHQQKPQKVVCLDRVFKGNDEALTNFQLRLKEAAIELTII